MDTMKGLRRSHYCGDVTEAGIEVTVGGFVDRVRNTGGVLFVVLRDRTGTVQLTFNDETDREIFEKAQTLRGEYVIMAHGKVTERENPNEKMKTGRVEIMADDLRILSKAQTPPFEIVDDSNANEELRLKYRYLDLRRAPLQKNILMRHEIAKAAREYFYDNGFIEIETPMMMRSTPEGARDYLVPSRIHPGSFYALPQSPQIYKQLLMVSGFDRYIQLARCFREPEFTQIDLEMSFVDEEDIQQCVEGFIAYVFEKVLGKKISLPLPRLTFADAMNRFGSDKPDTRFGFEITDITQAVKDIDFVVFRSAIENGGNKHQGRRICLHPQGDRQAHRTRKGHGRKGPCIHPLGRGRAEYILQKIPRRRRCGKDILCNRCRKGRSGAYLCGQEQSCPLGARSTSLHLCKAHGCNRREPLQLPVDNRNALL